MSRYSWRQLNEFAITAALLFRFAVSDRRQFVTGLVGQAVLDCVLTPRGQQLPRTDLERLADGRDFVEARIYTIVECKN